MTKMQKKLLRQTLGPSVRRMSHSLGSMAIGGATAAGGPIGGMIATQVNRAVQKKVNKLTGSGAYMAGRGTYMVGRGDYGGAFGGNALNPEVKNSLFVDSEKMNHTPQFKTSNDETGTIVIRRREYVAPILSTGSAAFSNQSFQINPGLASIFEWLAQIGANYSEYEFGQLVFIYKPTVSALSVSTVGSLGTLILATNPNAGESKYATFDAMINAHAAVSGNISQCIACGVECDPSKNNASELYIRTGTVPSGQDIKTYDHGLFQLAFFGIPTAYTAGTQLGLLFVEYTVKLRKPRMWSGLGNTILSDLFYSGGNRSNGLPLGNAPLTSTRSNLGGTITKLTESVYTFPDNFNGSVRVDSWATATTALTMVSGNITAAGNIVSFNGSVAGAGTNSVAVASAPGGPNQWVMNTKWYQVTPAATTGENTLTINVGTSTGTITMGFQVSLVNPLLTDFTSNNTTV